jgi:phospholipase/carboxylesterase
MAMSFVPGRLAGFPYIFGPATQPNAPILLLLHGTGGNREAMIPLGQSVAPGAALISPQAPPSADGQTRFVAAPDPDHLPDEAHFREATDRLAIFLLAALHKHVPGVEGTGAAPRVVVMGYSSGAQTAAALTLLHPELLIAALIFRPLLPWIPDPLPDLHGFPVFVACGREDFVTPPEEAQKLAAVLKQADAEVVLRWQEAGHRINAGELSAAAGWLAETRASRNGVGER